MIKSEIFNENIFIKLSKTFFKIKKYKNEQANMRMSQLHSQFNLSNKR